MKKKYLFGFALMIAISATIAFFVFQANSVSAGDLTFEERLNQPPLQTPFPEGATPVPDNEDQAEVVSEEQVAINKTVLEEVKKLFDQANEANRKTAGWWHTERQEISISPDPKSNTLPDGRPIPSELDSHEWFLLDENGYVVKSVTIQYGKGSEIIQVSAYNNGIATNFTYGMSWEEKPQLYYSNGEFGKDVDVNTVVLDLHDAMLDGEPEMMVYTITTKGLQTKGIVDGHLVDLEVPIIGTVTKFYISKKTDTFIAFEIYNHLADGTEELIQRMTIIVDEKITEPPAEILKYLN